MKTIKTIGTILAVLICLALMSADETKSYHAHFQRIDPKIHEVPAGRVLDFKALTGNTPEGREKIDSLRSKIRLQFNTRAEQVPVVLWICAEMYGN